MVHPDHADPKFNYSRMTCRACIQLPLDIGGIDASMYTEMIRNPHILLVNLASLYNERNPDIGTLKKDRGGIFSECCKEIFKEIFLHYVNEVLFARVFFSRVILKEFRIFPYFPIVPSRTALLYATIKRKRNANGMCL